MPVVTKNVSVRFYVLEPFGNPLPFAPGAYPRDTVFKAIQRLDPAEPSYRIQEDLFGGETLCLFHSGDAGLVLGAYFKDLLNLPQTEYKGEVLELVLRDGEAVVDGAYAMFFPNDVVGIIRTSNKAPGASKIGAWLSLIGGVECGIVPLRDPDATAQLDQAQGRLRRLFLRARRDRIPLVRGVSPTVAEALRSAGETIPSSNEVGVEISASGSVDRNRYGADLRERVEELFPLFPEFVSAEVWVSGRQRPINLKRSYLIAPQQVHLLNSRKIGPAEAAQAITAAYRHESEHIQLAARVHRGQPDAPPSG